MQLSFSCRLQVFTTLGHSCLNIAVLSATLLSDSANQLISLRCERKQHELVKVKTLPVKLNALTSRYCEGSTVFKMFSEQPGASCFDFVARPWKISGKSLGCGCLHVPISVPPLFPGKIQTFELYFNSTFYFNSQLFNLLILGIMIRNTFQKNKQEKKHLFHKHVLNIFTHISDTTKHNKPLA